MDLDVCYRIVFMDVSLLRLFKKWTKTTLSQGSIQTDSCIAEGLLEDLIAVEEGTKLISSVNRASHLSVKHKPDQVDKGGKRSEQCR